MSTNPRIPYVSMVGQADQDLVPHLLKHYRALGVTEFHIALHGIFRRPILERLAAEADVSTYTTPKVQFDDALKDEVIGEITRDLRGLWIVYADADEFLELPLDALSDTLDCLDEFGMDALPAFMIQRMHPDGLLPSLNPDDDIGQVFGSYDFNLCERLNPKRPNWKTKFPIHKVVDGHQPSAGNHWPPTPQLNVHMPLRGTVSHYKWRSALFDAFKLARGAGTNSHELSAYEADIHQRRGRLPNEGARSYSRGEMYRLGYLSAPSAKQRSNAVYWRGFATPPVSSTAPFGADAAPAADAGASRTDSELVDRILSPENLQGPLGKICFVTSRLSGVSPKGGLTIAISVLIERLAQHGHAVTVLFCETSQQWSPSKRGLQYWKKLGIALEFLKEDGPEATGDLPYGKAAAVARYLNAHSFDVVHFDDTFGYGGMACEIRRAGLGLERTAIVTVAHGSARWHRLGNQSPIGHRTMTVDWALQKQLDLSDLVIHPSRYMLQHVEANHSPQAPAIVVPNILSGWTRRFADQGRDAVFPDEVVFFGRIERRKGFDVFQQALTLLPEALRKKLSVTVIGIRGDTLSKSQISTFFEGLSLTHRIVQNFDSIDAVNYLRSRNCIVVIPSKVDNLPYTIYECLENGIPMICSDAGGIPELVDESDHDRIMVANDAVMTAEFIATAVAGGVVPARLGFDPETAAIHYLSAFAWLIGQGRNPTRMPEPSAASLTTLVLRESREIDAEDALGVLRGPGTRYRENTVTVLDCVDRGDSLQRTCLEAIRASSSEFVVLWHGSVKPSAPANPIDAGLALLANGQYGAVVYSFDALYAPAGYPIRVRIENIGAPAGPPERSASWNVYGAGVAIFRRDVLLDLDWAEVSSDRVDFLMWQILNQIAARGLMVGSVPVPLITRVLAGREDLQHGEETELPERLCRPWLHGSNRVQEGMIRGAVVDQFGTCPYAERIRKAIDTTLNTDAETDGTSKSSLFDRVLGRQSRSVAD